ncbi:MAG: helix-turn-helix domain-containing protein [Tamlana sp.]
MLKTVQIIALIQGLFLLIVLFKNKNNYLKPTLYLLLGTIFSVILYIFGDDETNLISPNVDLFLFDKSLFITFLFLFVKYYLSKAKKFSLKDLFFFVPNLFFFVIELLEIIYSEGIFIIDFIEIFVELTFLGYMFYTLISLLKAKSQKWMLYFIVPLVIIIGFSILDEVLYWFYYEETFFAITKEHLGEYTIIVVAFLFYTIALKLVLSPKDILINKESEKYKNSSLHVEDFESIKSKLITLMEKDKIYTDSNLSIQKIAELLHVPRQYISEVLNNYMQTNFQAFVNSYRIEAFIEALHENKHEHYSLLGIAKDVGFNSKTSFNTSFKKLKNMTPSEYKDIVLKHK